MDVNKLLFCCHLLFLLFDMINLVDICQVFRVEVRIVLDLTIFLYAVRY